MLIDVVFLTFRIWIQDLSLLDPNIGFYAKMQPYSQVLRSRILPSRSTCEENQRLTCLSVHGFSKMFSTGIEEIVSKVYGSTTAMRVMVGFKSSFLAQHWPLYSKTPLTYEGLEFRAAIQCSDFLNQFRKSPDVYGVYCKCPL